MREPTERVGVEAVVEGATKFADDLRMMDSAYSRFVGRMNQSILPFVSLTKVAGSTKSAVGDLGGGISGMSSMSVLAAGALGGLGGVAASIAGGAFRALTGAVLDVGRSILSNLVELPKQAADALVGLAMGAAKLPGIAAAFAASAERSGLSLEALREGSRGMMSDFALMQQANIAMTGAGDELAQEFGQHIPELLAIAQASAKATGQSFDYMFESLITGIKRTQPRIIDNTYLQLKMGEANAQLSAELGITTDELTAEQQQIAILNATLRAGALMIEQMGGAQATASGRLTAMNAQLQNMRDSLGLMLQPALTTVLSSLSEFVNMMAGAISEGGALYPVLVNLAAGISLVADGFAAGLGGITIYIGDTIGGWADVFNQAATNAFTWGSNIVVNLAQGIINAAATALTTAMNFITSMLTAWLSPGSPPKVAPDIDKWGAEAMGAYLEGFTDADFDILEGLESVLRGALTGPAFADMSEALAEAIASGPDEAFFSQLGAATSSYGSEMVDLARQYFALVEAEDAAKAAEERLVGARTKVSDLTKEYNDLLRGGASKDVLDAKLAQINAAEGEEQAAEAANAEAQKGLDPMREQLKLQERLVQQLTEMARARQVAETAAAAKGKAPGVPKLPKGAGGGGAAALLQSMIPDPAVVSASITSALTTAIETAKGVILASWSGLWDAVFGDPRVQANLGLLSLAFINFANVVVGYWNAKLIPGMRIAFNMITTESGKIVDNWRSNVTPQLVSAFDAVTAALGSFGITWEGVFGSIGAFMAAWFVRQLVYMQKTTAAINWMATAVAKAINWVATAISNAIIFINEKGMALKQWCADVVLWFQDLYNQLVGHSIIPDLIAGIVAAFTGTDWLDIGADVVGGIIDGALKVLGKVGKLIIEGVAALFAGKALTEAVDDALGGLTESVEGFVATTLETLEGMGADVAKLASTMGQQLVSAAKLVATTFLSTLKPAIDAVKTSMTNANATAIILATTLRVVLVTSAGAARTALDLLRYALDALRGVMSAVQSVVYNLVSAFGSLGGRLQSSVSYVVTLAVSFGSLGSVMDNFRRGALLRQMDAWNSFLDTLNDIIDALRTIQRLLGMGGGGNRQVAANAAAADNTATARTFTPTQALAPSALQPVGRVTNIQIGPNYITNGMTLAQFDQRVRQVIRQELRVTG